MLKQQEQKEERKAQGVESRRARRCTGKAPGHLASWSRFPPHRALVITQGCLLSLQLRGGAPSAPEVDTAHRRLPLSLTAFGHHQSPPSCLCLTVFPRPLLPAQPTVPVKPGATSAASVGAERPGLVRVPLSPAQSTAGKPRCRCHWCMRHKGCLHRCPFALGLLEPHLDCRYTDFYLTQNQLGLSFFNTYR